ncbi:MAG TPA: tetratricopeptide repeat protein, partial [Umezawaea sp.]|nr:tetratricopeptide repeat protein [Umezawaea sp.]
ACSRLGLHEEAIEHLGKALDLAVHDRDRTELAHTSRALAYAWELRGDDRRAMDHARSALDLYRGLGQPVREAIALNQVGWYAARLNDFDTARDHCQAALTLHRTHHNPEGEAATLDSLGLIAHRTGDHRQAVDHYQQALVLYRALGDTYRVADTLDNSGHPHNALGQHDQARAVWQEALERYLEQGRDEDVEQVRRRLDGLASAPGSKGPPDVGGTTPLGITR